MRKILSVLMVLILSIGVGYCEELDEIDETASTSTVMDSVVSAKAIKDAFKKSGSACNRLEARESIEGLIYETAGGVYTKDDLNPTTLRHINSACISLSPADSAEIVLCNDCLFEIIAVHNRFVQEQVNKTKIFTSEEEYNRALRNNGLCHYGENTTYTQPGSDEITLGKCKKYCKKVAVANACYLNSVYYDRDNGSRFVGTCECAYGANDVHVWQTGKTYYFMPTWEDYKKLFGIK